MITWVKQDDGNFFVETAQGRAIIKKNKFHPYHWKIEWMLLPKQLEDVQMMLQEVKQKFQAVSCSIVSKENSLLVTALEKEEFSCLRHCYEGSVRLEARMLTSKSDDLFSIDQLTESQMQSLQNRMVAEYRLYHEQISPLSRELSAKAIAKQLLMQTEKEWSFVQLHDQNYFITEKITPQTAFVTYVGGQGNEQSLLQFYKSCLTTLHSLGVENIEYEIDDTNPKQWILTQLFPISDESFDTYIFDKK